MTTADPKRELKASLKNVRLLVKEVGYNYLASLQGELTKIEEDIRYIELKGGSSRKHQNSYRKMLKLTGALKVKPPKGRRKDLKHLDLCIQKLKAHAQDF